MELSEFVRSHVTPPARVLEVGCGDGTLALELAVASFDVLAIDPVAPEGAIFRRTTLEELDEPGPFAAVVASRSLHHVGDLDVALDRVAAVLEPGGVVLVDEFAPDRLDEATSEWYHGQLRAVAIAAGAEPPPALEEFRARLAREHEGLHGSAAVRAALDARFEERSFSWEPYLWRELGGVASRALERTLIEAGAVQATGYRYAGRRSEER